MLSSTNSDVSKPPVRPSRRPGAVFRAHETARAESLDGEPLATFTQRAAGFGIDFVIVSALRGIVALFWTGVVPHGWERHTLIDFTHVLSVAIFLAYFTLAVYLGKGRTPGKWLARTQVISLTHDQPTIWQSLERALGYGASVVEVGIGFFQFFRNVNRQCAHDRLAQTFVADRRARPAKAAG
jgi:uncharacterized RDD family membrane protein YckC